MRYIRRLVCLLAVLLLALAGAQAEGKVIPAEEAEPFAEDAPLLEMYVCPLMGADCMVLVQGEHAMLVDMGKANDLSTIRSVLDSLGLTHFEYAFNTHPHTDHLGSMVELAKAYSFDRFVTGFDETFHEPSAIQRSTIKALKAMDMEIVRMGDGDVFNLGDAQLTVIQQLKVSGANKQSMMLMVEFGDCRMLLGADVTGQAQDVIASTHDDLHADVLKYPHHGLNELTSAFLEAVNPSYGVFTHGSLDTSAAQQVLDSIDAFYSFATWGTIHLATDGHEWHVEQPMDEEKAAYAEYYWKRKNAGH